MEALTRGVSIQKALIVGVLLATAPPAAWSATAAGRRGCDADAPARTSYPSFCAIPAKPQDVRTAKAFKAAVVETRLAGRQVVRDTAPQTFVLPAGEADAFSRAGQAAVAPAGTLAAPADTDDFAGDARREVVPPPLPRRRIAPPPQ